MRISRLFRPVVSVAPVVAAVAALALALGMTPVASAAPTSAVAPSSPAAWRTGALPGTASYQDLRATAPRAAETAPVGHTYTGAAFDKCDAPPLNRLKAWDESPYRAIAVYVGGHNRLCDEQSNLTADWVSQVQADNWSLIPLFVGRQSSCYVPAPGKDVTRITPGQAAAQGKAAADKAVTAMQTLGLGPHEGNPIYYNLESWDSDTTPDDQVRCAAEAAVFVDAWTVELHAQGYLSGLYSSAKGFIPAMVSAAQGDIQGDIQRDSQGDSQAGWQDGGAFTAPDALWIARHGTAATTSDPAVPANLWAHHQRIKQYAGSHDETWGGVTFNIDSNIVDGPVAAPGTLTIGQRGTITRQPGEKVSVQLKTEGASGSVTYDVVGGTLPDGITLSKAGKLSGATKALGDSTLTIRATDGSGAFGVRTLRLLVAFPDVPVSAPFFGDITWLANQGITGGTGDGMFAPSLPVTRGQMAAFMYRMTHDGTHAKKCTAKAGAPFTDVPVKGTFCGAITWLSGSGITGGTGGGMFSPAESVTRGQMAAFIYRMTHGGTHAKKCPAITDAGGNTGGNSSSNASGSDTGGNSSDNGSDATPEGRFTDVPASNVFCGAIAWLAQQGITHGTGDGMFSPGSSVTRGQMAAFLHRIPPRALTK